MFIKRLYIAIVSPVHYCNNRNLVFLDQSLTQIICAGAVEISTMLTKRMFFAVSISNGFLDLLRKFNQLGNVS